MAEISPLQSKKILLGVTGSIAAYKAADLIRRLKEQGADVRVVMTKSATEFITPLTLQTLSGHPVAIELLDADQESAMGHITLARWADWIVVAPASADFIARMALGRANDLLTALILATSAPIAIAPAMNNKMWANIATQENLQLLKKRAVQVIGPASGDQACGEQGEGRLVEPQDIVTALNHLVLPPLLKGKKVLITAGPTHEAIDPIRYIANRSSGKMGYALAEAAQQLGAYVSLVSGPVELSIPTNVNRISVTSAEDMYHAVMEQWDDSDIFISCAAVADFKPASQAQQKIKKQNHAAIQLELEPTQDILSEVASRASASQYVVGFAAETNAVIEYAKDKLERKSLDMIAANDVSDDKVFGKDDNALEVFWGASHQSLPTASKTELARQLIKLIAEQYHAKNTT